jgi:flagellar protein FlgJ
MLSPLTATLAASAAPAASSTAASTTAATSAQHRKLTDAAQQFEGMLLQELLKPLGSKGADADPDNELNSDDSSGDIMKDFGTEAVARAMAKCGAFGIAQRLVAQVERSQTEQTQKTDTSTGAAAGQSGAASAQQATQAVQAYTNLAATAAGR